MRSELVRLLLNCGHLRLSCARSLFGGTLPPGPAEPRGMELRVTKTDGTKKKRGEKGNKGPREFFLSYLISGPMWHGHVSDSCTAGAIERRLTRVHKRADAACLYGHCRLRPRWSGGRQTSDLIGVYLWGTAGCDGRREPRRTFHVPRWVTRAHTGVMITYSRER